MDGGVAAAAVATKNFKAAEAFPPKDARGTAMFYAAALEQVKPSLKGDGESQTQMDTGGRIGTGAPTKRGPDDELKIF